MFILLILEDLLLFKLSFRNTDLAINNVKKINCINFPWSFFVFNCLRVRGDCSCYWYWVELLTITVSCHNSVIDNWFKLSPLVLYKDTNYHKTMMLTCIYKTFIFTLNCGFFFPQNEMRWNETQFNCRLKNFIYNKFKCMLNVIDTVINITGNMKCVHYAKNCNV